jgi:hypothetical protein
MKETERPDGPNKKEELEKEYARWKDYANVLMIALTVLFAGPAIGGHKDGWSIASTICGVSGIVFVVFWHDRGNVWQFRGNPLFLVLASATLGAQATCLVFGLLWG